MLTRRSVSRCTHTDNCPVSHGRLSILRSVLVRRCVRLDFVDLMPALRVRRVLPSLSAGSRRSPFSDHAGRRSHRASPVYCRPNQASPQHHFGVSLNSLLVAGVLAVTAEPPLSVRT